MVIIAFFVIHWYTSLFFQTVFLHRYAAHKMFTMSKFWERVFYVLTFIFQGSNYLSAHAYGAMHRKHHAFADTEHDPHSPKYSTGIFDMMWKTKTIYSDILYGRVKLEDKYMKDLPEWTPFDKIADHWISRIIWGVLYILFYVEFATHWSMYLLLPIHFLMAPVHGAIINWFAHKFGYTNFKVSDTSVNLLPFDFLMMGEGYHNNHHKHGSRVNFGVKWHEIDVSYLILKVLHAVGIVKLKKMTPIEAEDNKSTKNVA